jgi:hypothetical protein
MKNNDSLKMGIQFSIFLVNKPGILSRVCHQLADRKINIVAMTMMDSTEHGVLRLVVENPEQARETLARLDVPRTETSVLLAKMPNRPGALADVVERLAVEHVNVHYAYCTTGATGGKTLGVFKVSNANKAVQVLSERKVRRKARSTAIRSNGRMRRK